MTTLDKAYGLVIGISEYRHVNPLPAAVIKDACAIHDALINPKQCGYTNVTLLTNTDATRDNIRKGLASLAEKTDTESQVFIYFSGHGFRIEDGEERGEYLLPVEASISSAQSTRGSAISDNELTDALKAIKAQKIVVLFDCCHAAGMADIKDAKANGGRIDGAKAGLSENLYDQLKTGYGRVIISSCRSDEVSWVIPDDANSLFTKHLLAALHGGVTSSDGFIRIFDLFEYLQPKVTAEKVNQHPIFKAEVGENFPIAMYLGGQKRAVQVSERSFGYDVYISCVDRDPDRSWVWQTLVPKLKAEGLTVGVAGDVEEIGIPIVDAIADVMMKSKRTLVVLSPQFLKDTVGSFTSAMAMTMGFQEGTYRVAPLKFMTLEDHKVPLTLRHLMGLDFSDPARNETNFKKLINTLKSPLPRILSAD